MRILSIFWIWRDILISCRRRWIKREIEKKGLWVRNMMAMLLDSPAIVTMRDKDGRTVSTMKVNEVRIHSLGGEDV